MVTTTRRVAVVGGNRIPFARSDSAYADVSNQDMLTAAIDGLVARSGASLQDFDLYEIHEAFACRSSLRCHGRTDHRQPRQAPYERGAGNGVIPICAAGGEGVTMILER
jgi:acetyl-CoA acetyltransferase